MSNTNTQLIQKAKRRRDVQTKRWTDTEEMLILNYLVELIPKNKQFEKPNAVAFYKTMTEELGLVVSASSQTMNKVKHLRTSYVKAVDWKTNTGAGVEEGTVDEYVKRMCPHFDILDEIFGHKTNIVPPYIYESGVTDQEVNSKDTSLDYEFLDEANFYRHNDDRQRVIDAESLGLNDENVDIAENAEMVDYDEIDEDFPVSPDHNKSTSSFDSRKAKFKWILGNVPPKPLSSSQEISPPNSQHVSRFKKRLLASPVIDQDKSMPRNSSSILAEAQRKKAEAIFGRNDIDKARAENEKIFKLEKVAKEKFNFKKEVRQSEIELRKTEIELREKEIQSRERIEMYRIEVEAKNNLEIAKLRSTNFDR